MQIGIVLVAVALAASLTVLSAGADRLRKCLISVRGDGVDRINHVRLQVSVLRLAIVHSYAAGALVGVMDLLNATATAPSIVWYEVPPLLLPPMLAMALLAECILRPLRNHLGLTLTQLERPQPPAFPVVPVEETLRRQA